MLSEAFFTAFDLFAFVFNIGEEEGIISLCELTALLMYFTLLSIVIVGYVFNF